MDANEKPARRRWQKKRWRFALVLWLVWPAAYMLAPGLLEYCKARRWPVSPACERLFAPALLVVGVSDQVNNAYFRYLIWCMMKGNEHGALSTSPPSG